jgi:hypothetical protein
MTNECQAKLVTESAKYVVTKIHCPFVLLSRDLDFHRIALETTQIWGKEFPADMFQHGARELLFFLVF